MHRVLEKDRFKTAVDIRGEITKQTGVEIGVQIVRRRLREFGLTGRVARKESLFRAKNIKAGLAFAKEHFHWTQDQ